MSREESAWVKYVFGMESTEDREILKNVERILDKWQKKIKGYTNSVEDVKKNVSKEIT